ncbi:MAG: virulence RhuM family protein [Bacteroidaceae bacterium]|nr:virulence RhuM family protein [Bacteroidaceae bacterium]
MPNEIELFSPEEMQSPFDAIKETDAEGREWWNSRHLARLMGYQKYWNFERLVDKVASFLQQEKGQTLAEHIVEIEELAQLNNGGWRQVKSYRLSRMACLAIATNADAKKTIVKAAKEYFSRNMTSAELATSVEGNVLIYRSSTGKVNVSVLFSNETFWLSQKRMAELFNVALSTINYHLSQIDESGELQLSTAIRKFRIPSDNCDEQGVLMYNLDVIIAVGYRVNSYEATQFRIWAREVLKEYIIKGFVMDDERLKGKNPFGADYFDELLERIREIRTSERRYYQKITDIYAECSIDYDRESETTRTFYKTVQNMMHYAVTHQTAAEIVYERADAEKPHMGLMTWKNAPDGRVVKSDVTIAKNYLSEQEVDELNLLTTAFLDIAERRARRHVLTTMAEWKQVLEQYLNATDADVLPNAGSVSHEEAEAKALGEYEKFRRIQDKTLLSDFDKFIEGLK